MEDRQTASWASNALLLVFAGVVALVIWNLAAENRELKGRLEALAGPPLANMLQADDLVPSVELVSAGGRRAHLDELLGSGGVIAFLTTTCPFCEQTRPLWADLSARYAERDVPFLGVSFDSRAETAAYAEANDVDWPLWTVADPEDIPELKVSSVPFTVLVTPGGRIERVWLGVLEDADVAALRGALDQQLAAAASESDLPATE